MYIKTILSAAILLALSGCATNAVKDNYVVVDGKEYKRDKNGVVELSKEQLELIKGKKGVVVVDDVLPSGSVAISEDEMKLLNQDQQLLDEVVTGKPIDNGVYTFILRKGSLAENLERLAKKYSTDEDTISINYTGHDYFVNESRIVRGNSLEMITADILSEFPVFTAIDEKEE